MATYYVATTGNDNNVGSEASPFRNPYKGAQVAQPGDTVIVKNGTYTGYVSVGSIHANIMSYNVNGVSGTAANPITIKAENAWGAKLVTPQVTGTAVSAGVYLRDRNYINIENFEIQGGGTSTNSEVGIGITSCNNINIRHNWIHDIGRMCSASTNGFPGASCGSSNNVLFEWNYFKLIGRYNGIANENGCTLEPNPDAQPSHDHAIYFATGNDNTARYNLIAYPVAGYAFHIYKSGGANHQRLKIYNNTMYESNPFSTTTPAHMILCHTMGDCEFKNNLSANANNGLFTYLSLTPTNCVASYNQCSGALFATGKIFPSGITFSNNSANTSPGFINALGDNFRLAAGSAALESGTNVGLSYNGSAPSKGCFDPPKFSSATVTSGSANVVKVHYTCNVAPPLLPASGVTGFTCRVNGVARTINSAAVVNSTEVHLTLASAVSQGDTVDISYSTSTGNLTDSAFRGMMPQPVVQTLTNQAVSNTATSPSVAPAAPTGLVVTKI